ncbi:hypothetical protein ACIF6I_26285 [Streptomyces microflavus]|uniref:hypothetical protein n=1 Tax=Streptomyces microflavus TaxID=1919 RepID=UPI00344C5DD9
MKERKRKPVMSVRVNRVDARRGPADAAQLYHGLRRVVTVTSGEVHAMSSADSEQPIHPPTRPRQTVEELLAAKGTRPIASLDDLTADTFGTDEEVEEFVAFTYSERRRDVA